jgi:hypothetical protein
MGLRSDISSKREFEPQRDLGTYLAEDHLYDGRKTLKMQGGDLAKTSQCVARKGMDSVIPIFGTEDLMDHISKRKCIREETLGEREKAIIYLCFVRRNIKIMLNLKSNFLDV